MNAYQLKAAIKNQKPLVWRRCIVPGGITYSQLSLILTDVMDRQEEADFEFEFYQKKIRFGESREDKPLRSDFFYSVAEASEFYIDELLDTEDWFSFYYGDQLKLRVTIEKRLGKDGNEDAYPIIVKAKMAVTEEDVSETDLKENLLRINSEMKKKYAVRYEGPEYKTREQIQKDHQNGKPGLVGWQKAENDPEKIRYSSNHYMELMAGILQKALQGGVAEEFLSPEEQRFLEKARRTGQERMGAGAEDPQAFRREAQEEKGQRGKEGQRAEEGERAEEGQRTKEGERAEEEQQQALKETDKGRISLTERLQWENKEQLLQLGKEFGLSGISSLSKFRLAEKIANHLLMADVMEDYFIGQDEEKILAWEAAAAIGTRHHPPAEHVGLLEQFYEDNYLAMYEDDSVEIPLAVAESYEKINTPGFQSRRKRVTWMQACLHMHAMIYGSAPALVVMRLYRKKPGYRLKQSEFYSVFQDVPERENPCVVHGDKVIKKFFLKDEYYVKIEKMQELWDFVIPEADEIEDCYQNGYPSKERHYRELKDFLTKETGWGEDKIKDCLARIWAWTTQGYDSRDIESDLRQEGLVLENKSRWKEFIRVLEKAQEFTRRLEYRGHMPVQVRRVGHFLTCF